MEEEKKKEKERRSLFVRFLVSQWSANRACTGAVCFLCTRGLSLLKSAQFSPFLFLRLLRVEDLVDTTAIQTLQTKACSETSCL